MKKIFITILTLAAAMGVFAQENESLRDTILTLQQCIDMAVANNAALKRADNTALAATQTRKEVFTKYFPEISATGFGFRSHNYIFQYNALIWLLQTMRH